MERSIQTRRGILIQEKCFQPANFIREGGAPQRSIITDAAKTLHLRKEGGKGDGSLRGSSKKKNSEEKTIRHPFRKRV